MSQTELKSPPKNPQQGVWPGLEESEDSKHDYLISLAVGLLVTLLVHLAFILFVPWDKMFAPEPRELETVEPMQLEFVEYELPKFVETNPNVAPERPEETENIAAQDQVAAQENPDPTSDSDKPEVDGELLESSKIVEGAIADPTPPPEPLGQQLPEQEQQPDQEPTETPPLEQPTPEPVQETSAPEATEPELVPEQAAPEALEQETQQPEGELALEKPADAEPKEEIPEEPAEEQKQPEPQPKETPKVMMEEVVPQTTTQSGQPTPQARPRINFRVPAGPLMKQGQAASRMGSLAIDANFSEFGAYQQRMIEAISAAWTLLGSQSRYTGADIGTNCVVEFVLNREGTVTNVRVLHSSSSAAGTLMTTEAIKSRAPYGPWTQDMIKVLGEQQTVRINFFYR